jgi:hypothetical protein
MSLKTWIQVKRLKDLLDVNGLTEEDKSNIQMAIDLLEKTENPFARRVAITVLKRTANKNTYVTDIIGHITKELEQ